MRTLVNNSSCPGTSCSTLKILEINLLSIQFYAFLRKPFNEIQNQPANFIFRINLCSQREYENIELINSTLPSVDLRELSVSSGSSKVEEKEEHFRKLFHEMITGHLQRDVQVIINNYLSSGQRWEVQEINVNAWLCPIKANRYCGTLIIFRHYFNGPYLLSRFRTTPPPQLKHPSEIIPNTTQDCFKDKKREYRHAVMIRCRNGLWCRFDVKLKDD